MNLKTKHIFFALLLCVWAHVTVAQPNYRQAMFDTTANFYSIQNDFYNWYDTIDLPDSVKNRALKHYTRWESMFHNKLQSNEPDYHGSFTGYTKAFGSYWLDPSCITPDNANWQNIGPFPADLHDMGFIHSIWVHPSNPSIMLVGSGRISGILKSTNFGQTWYDVLSPSRIPALGITYISSTGGIDHELKDNIYASTGSTMTGFSIGILKSDDEGETWEIMDNFPPYATQEFNYVVEKVIKAPGTNLDPDVIYAITNTKFYSSTDGGTNWTYYNFYYDGVLKDMEVDPNNKNIIAVSGDPSDPTTESPMLWLSTDGGSSFTEILGSSGYANLQNVRQIQIDFPSSDRLYMLTRERELTGSYKKPTGSVFYYDLSQTPMAWDISNTNNYYATGAPTGGQFNRAFHVTDDYQTFYIGTENLSIANPNSNASIIPGTQFPYQTTANTHCDIRCLYVRDGNIWLGTDGGLTHRMHDHTNWISLNGKGHTGIVNNEIVGFDITEGYDKRIVVGMIDNSFKLLKDNQWLSSTTMPIIIKNQAGIWETQPPDGLGLGDVGSCVFTPASDDWFWASALGFAWKTEILDDDFMGYCDILNEIPGLWFRTPLAINSQNPNQLFAGGVNGKIIKIIDDGLDYTKSIVQLGVIADVLNIVLAPSDESIMYATTNYYTYSGTLCEKGIYRSDDGGTTWTDITGGNCSTGVKNHNYHITSVAVDWDNPNKVWVSMSGVPFHNVNKTPYLENRVFRTDDASADTVEWIDMTNGPNGILPPLPTTAIVNQPGTDRVFLATDGGIFYRGDNDPDWTCFSNGFPITHITDLKIDRITNEIFASTYGYSILKANLPCLDYENPLSYLIETDVVWSNLTKTMNGDIYVFSGNTLTINNKSVIHMAPGNNIFVHSGAKLIIDDATITSCGGMWQGITVYGTFNQHQTYANQGVVRLLNGVTIANARAGIETGKNRTAGGIIQAENSGFYNCEFAIKMHPYRNFNPNNQNITWPNVGFFKECTFATTRDLLDQGVHPKSHIWLNGIQHLSILGNTFENRIPLPHILTDWTDRGSGLFSINSIVNIHELCTSIVTPCTEVVQNRFLGLNYGVYSMADNSLRATSVDNALFDKNRYGIYYGGIYGAKVTRSEFLIPPDLSVKQRSYGLYLDNCTGYTIEENHFQNAEPLNNSTVGLIVNNSGADFNELYNNTFHDLGWGILAQHDNRGVDKYTGLKVKCNDFSEVIHVDLGISLRASHTGVTGISEYQGGNVNVKSPAGNTFSWAGTNPLSDINNNGLVISKYYHHDIQGQTPAQGENWVPVFYDPYKVLLEPVPYKNYIKEQACPLNSGIDPGTILHLYSKYHDYQIEELSADLILAIYRDGGMENLPELVELAYPYETYYYYNLLITESPYLSDQTMIAAINNTDLLPDLLLKLVLVANPHCTRSDEVMAALEARNPQLPEYMIEEIMMGEDLPSPLEGLEAAVAYWIHLKQMTLHQVIRTYMSDTTSTNGRDSLMAIFAREENPIPKFAKTFLYFSENEHELGIYWFEEIESLFMDHEYLFQQYAEYALFLPIAVEMQRDSVAWDDLTVDQKNDLYFLADEGLYYPAAYARTMLLQHDSEYQYEEPIIFPYTQIPRKRRPVTPAPFTGTPELKVYPNPANNYLVVEYRLEKEDLPALLRITNAQGQLAEQVRIDEATGQYVMNCQGLVNGIYIVSLLTKRNKTTTKKVSIVK